MGLFQKQSNYQPGGPAEFIKMLERASFEEREKMRLLLDAVAVEKKEDVGISTSRPNVLIVSTE